MNARAPRRGRLYCQVAALAGRHPRHLLPSADNPADHAGHTICARSFTYAHTALTHPSNDITPPPKGLPFAPALSKFQPSAAPSCLSTDAEAGTGDALKRRFEMTKTLTAIAFALSIGLVAGTVSANELGGKENIANPFPVYTTING